MLSSRLPVVALLCGAIAAFGLCAQTAPAPEPKGSIEGRVVSALSGEGLRKVSLTLNATRGKGSSATAQSDENGRFAFRELAPGGYRLSAERTGFLRQEYGARLNPNSGAVLALAPGQEVKDLTFKLPPNAIISGRVLDQEGEPMPGLIVSAYRNNYVQGRRQWTQSGGAQTNDRGEYRIANLRAARYVVCASNLNLGIGLAAIDRGALPEKPEPAYASTCYGNSTDMEGAAPAEVRMGEDRRGTDIQMAKTATVRVRGKVTGAPEGKVLLVMLVPRNAAAAGQAPAGVGLVQQTDGAFEVRGVVPGSYLLTARSATEVMTSIVAPRPLEVAGSHIDGVELAMGGGGTLSGRVITSPEKPAGAANPSVALEWADFSLPGLPSVTTADDGKFAIKGLYAGRYRLRVENMPDNGYLKSVKLDGREADPAGMDLGPGRELEIALSRAGARVEGSVLGTGDKPLAGATVTLLPESARQAHYRTATTDHDGTFQMGGVPPGKYKLLAWEDLEPGAHLDREFVKPFEGPAQTVALEENGQSKVTLKAIASRQ